jgi:hypothetical protein
LAYNINTALLKLIAPIIFLSLSGIQPSCVDGLPDEEEEKALTLEWHKWVVKKEFRIEEYSMKSLLFAKLDKPLPATEADPRFRKGGEWRINTNVFMAAPD